MTLRWLFLRDDASRQSLCSNSHISPMSHPDTVQGTTNTNIYKSPKMCLGSLRRVEVQCESNSYKIPQQTSVTHKTCCAYDNMVQYSSGHFPAAPQMNYSCVCSYPHPVPGKCFGPDPGLGMIFYSTHSKYSKLFLSKSSPLSQPYFFHQALLADPSLLCRAS